MDIALDLGFEYPEVFSRAFKKEYGISPAQFREKPVKLERTPKACLVERDIINYRGVLAVKGHSIFQEGFKLSGITMQTSIYNEDFRDSLLSKSEDFITKSAGIPWMDQDRHFTVVNCHGEDNGEYTVFCGRRPVSEVEMDVFQERDVPGGWYVSFQYFGDMFSIRESFVDDLYRWIVVKQAALNPNGIGMINIYPNDYRTNQSVTILIPVKKPI